MSSKSPWGGVEGFREEVMPWPAPTGWVGVCWCTGGRALRETQSQPPISSLLFPPISICCALFNLQVGKVIQGIPSALSAIREARDAATCPDSQPRAFYLLLCLCALYGGTD